jgi:hypothetical protein
MHVQPQPPIPIAIARACLLFEIGVCELDVVVELQQVRRDRHRRAELMPEPCVNVRVRGFAEMHAAPLEDAIQIAAPRGHRPIGPP